MCTRNKMRKKQKLTSKKAKTPKYVTDQKGI